MLLFNLVETGVYRVANKRFWVYIYIINIYVRGVSLSQQSNVTKESGGHNFRLVSFHTYF